MIEELFQRPHKFNFFQAVRLLQQEGKHGRGDRHGLPIGHDSPPSREVVRFRAAASQTFSGSGIAALKRKTDRRQKAASQIGDERRETSQQRAIPPRPPEMPVSFMGLTGPDGVLPQHFTTLVMERMREKDFALRDFLDLFNHRSISLFYRAWEKHRAGVSYENDPGNDAFTQSLFALTGLGASSLRNRQQFDDDAVIFYGGHFAHRRPTACALERMLGEFFELPVTVQPFCGQWIQLDQHTRTQLPGGTASNGARSLGQNHQLGVSAVLGQRMWDVQHKFRVKLGPLSAAQFATFLPCADGLAPLCDFVRSYAGSEFDFDVQPVLAARQTPRLQLTARQPAAGAPAGTRLGWNSWLCSRPVETEVSDAVFQAPA